jgi:hypothetical protein
MDKMQRELEIEYYHLRHQIHRVFLDTKSLVVQLQLEMTQKILNLRHHHLQIL